METLTSVLPLAPIYLERTPSAVSVTGWASPASSTYQYIQVGTSQLGCISARPSARDLCRTCSPARLASQCFVAPPMLVTAAGRSGRRPRPRPPEAGHLGPQRDLCAGHRRRRCAYVAASSASAGRVVDRWTRQRRYHPEGAPNRECPLPGCVSAPFSTIGVAPRLTAGGGDRPSAMLAGQPCADNLARFARLVPWRAKARPARARSAARFDRRIILREDRASCVASHAPSLLTPPACPHSPPLPPASPLNKTTRYLCVAAQAPVMTTASGIGELEVCVSFDGDGRSLLLIAPGRCP